MIALYVFAWVVIVAAVAAGAYEAAVVIAVCVVLGISVEGGP